MHAPPLDFIGTTCWRLFFSRSFSTTFRTKRQMIRFTDWLCRQTTMNPYKSLPLNILWFVWSAKGAGWQMPDPINQCSAVSVCMTHRAQTCYEIWYLQTFTQFFLFASFQTNEWQRRRTCHRRPQPTSHNRCPFFFLSVHSWLDTIFDWIRPQFNGAFLIDFIMTVSKQFDVSIERRLDDEQRHEFEINIFCRCETAQRQYNSIAKIYYRILRNLLLTVASHSSKS